MKKIVSVVFTVALVVILLIVSLSLTGCSIHEPTGTEIDIKQTVNNANKLQINQPTPSDIDYSLERYNLIRRAYWVNGQREKAMSLPCEIADIPLGYVVLFTESGGVVGRFCVHGKVSSLNSFLTPDSEYYSGEATHVSAVRRDGGYSNSNYYTVNKWLADVDGSYGENDSGIFFFTPDGKYIEWSGCYLYSDIPFEVENPVVSYTEG